MIWRIDGVGVGILLAVGLGCPPGGLDAADTPVVTDIGVESGFQDSYFGHHKKGRACVAADFDLDGAIDFYFGNPGDESFVVRAAGLDAEGIPQYEVVQLLLDGAIAVGGSAADYDDDGDYDLFIACAGIEGTGTCYLFRNQLVETGGLSFEDVTLEAGVAGGYVAGSVEPLASGYTNGVWGDYDRDGDVDLFVGNASGVPAVLLARNVLWRNNGDATFTDVTEEVGLVSHLATLHSTWFDIDNDGDLDLYETNYSNVNILWKNLLVETAEGRFLDVTSQFSPPGEDMSTPLGSFASAAQDFNHDGWQDLMVFRRGPLDWQPEPLYTTGHVLFLNMEGTGFTNVADQVGLNDPYFDGAGIMGCQLGDLNGDGVVDLYMGHGAPSASEADQLYVSDTSNAPIGSLPAFHDRTSWIDFPAPVTPGIVPAVYPYRTHGTNFVDVDGDGDLEIAVSNGGMYGLGDAYREPNRLFRFDWPDAFRFLKVRPVGDGHAVSRDAIGTRFALTVSKGETSWTLYNTLFGGSAFSAQQGFEVYFGLADAEEIDSLTITWPDGYVQTVEEGLELDTTVVIERACAVVTTPGHRGDCNFDTFIDLADAVFLLAYAYTEGTAAECPNACDANGDAHVDVADAIYLMNALCTPGSPSALAEAVACPTP